MDLLTAIFELTVVLFLVFLNGFFVAAEFAIVKIRASRLETLIQEGNKRAKYAKVLTDHLDASLSVTQLGITLASLGLGWLGEPVVAYLLHPLIESLGLSAEVGHSIAFILAFSFITALHIVLGELTPKSLAIQKVEKVVLGIALPMLVFQRIMYPAVWVLNHVANWVLRQIGVEVATEEDAAHTEAEIRILMEESHKQGYIDKTELTFV
ncbi:MAG: hemolysin family protein, partial [Selenomonadaceae bacterium]